jgi:Fe(3+) dicitrate transport protein
MRSKILVAAALLLSSSLSSQSFAVEDNRNKSQEKITITGGTYEGVKKTQGSVHNVDKKSIESKNITDVTRALREVPGLNIQEEDGYGLRPNIGMRGSRVDRSSDLTLMEDGVLIAPAPYAAPEAYYFPRIERMDSVEVIKGAGSIKYGPRTTNGAINLISTPIPVEKTAEAKVGYGSYNDIRAQLSAGDSGQNFGYAIDFSHQQTDGFKDIDFVGGDTGFDIQDFMGKIKMNTDASHNIYQEIELKAGLYDEISDETYLGLTTADFNADPNRRYASTQFDQMDVNQRLLQARHFIMPAAGLDITTTLYRTDVDREWYRLQSVNTGGSNITLPSALRNGGRALDVLRGASTAVGENLAVRSNNREYFAYGLQSELDYRFNLGAVKNTLETGFRLHRDEMDRFQREDTYTMNAGRMLLSSVGAPGSESNRISSADAWSVFAQNRFEYGAIGITPGVRYENINLKNEDFGKTDPTRTGSALKTFENDVDAIIPGIGADYTINQNWVAFAGVHKGFNPPAPPANATDAANIQEEESVNYEAGLRYAADYISADLVGFYNDYENIIGRDTFSSGGGSTADQFNGGEIQVYGLEAGLNYDANQLIKSNVYNFPARLSYTYTSTEFQNSFASTFNEWGNVDKGDELPYVPENQVYLSMGVEHPKWAANVGARWLDDTRAVAGQGAIPEEELIESSLVFDASGEYEIFKATRAFLTVNNIFDEEYVASRRPAGARPGLPQTFLTGLKVKF